MRRRNPRALPWTALVLVVSLLLGWLTARPAAAAQAPIERRYHCDGDPLVARQWNGPVDAIGIPNTSGGTVPGAFVTLQWRDLQLQLPRTNNAGPPSYTDGRWWWSLEDPHHPRFLQQRGDVRQYPCEAAG